MVLKTPITYYGGKQKMAAKILSIIPPHVTYCEPFFGGGAVFFQKPKSQVEIINDINRFVVNFYRQAQNNFEALQAKIRETLHSRSLYTDARVMYEHPHLFDELQHAWAFWVLCNQGYLGKMGSWGFETTGAGIERRNKSKREEFTSEISERLDLVQVECHDALYLIQLRDRPETFFYLDPPYFNSNCGHYGGYNQDDFERLLQLCASMQGKFLLSSYPSEILSRFAGEHGWHQIELGMTCSASSKRKTKIEVLTANYPISDLP